MKCIACTFSYFIVSIRQLSIFKSIEIKQEKTKRSKWVCIEMTWPVTNPIHSRASMLNPVEVCCCCCFPRVCVCVRAGKMTIIDLFHTTHTHAFVSEWEAYPNGCAVPVSVSVSFCLSLVNSVKKCHNHQMRHRRHTHEWCSRSQYKFILPWSFTLCFVFTHVPIKLT